MTGQSYSAQILDRIIDLSKGQATIVERVDNIDTKLGEHLDECKKNGQRRKNEKGKYEERRQGKLRRWIPVVALIISIITLLGGWTFIKYQADNLNAAIQNYDKYKQSQSE